MIFKYLPSCYHFRGITWLLSGESISVDSRPATLCQVLQL